MLELVPKDEKLEANYAYHMANKLPYQCGRYDHSPGHEVGDH